VLTEARRSAPVFVGDRAAFDGDCTVLLRDAAKLFCEAVGAFQGMTPATCGCPELPELLQAHPELCDEMLARVEHGFGEDHESEIRWASV
jgi:hypothetical protein